MPRDGYTSLSVPDERAAALDTIVSQIDGVGSRPDAVGWLIDAYHADDTDREDGVHVASVDPDVVTELARASGEDVEGRLS